MQNVSVLTTVTSGLFIQNYIFFVILMFDGAQAQRRQFVK